jgi:hypothetical protein
VRITRDEVLRELISFFDCELAKDPAGVKDWLAQGDYDCDEFIKAVGQVDKELSLRDGPESNGDLE